MYDSYSHSNQTREVWTMVDLAWAAGVTMSDPPM
jgi:hypothetical protein